MPSPAARRTPEMLFPPSASGSATPRAPRKQQEIMALAFPFCAPGRAIARGLDFALKRAYEYQLISMGLTPEGNMAHKKIERKKELDRRRHRRAQRLKQRVREAKAAAKA